MKKAVLLLWALWALSQQTGRAQTLATRRYTIAEGLPQSTIYALCQDHYGQLWAGTQSGVCWFDGRQFHTFDSRQGLPDNHVTAVAEAADGTVWFGHRYGAISYWQHGRIRVLRPSRWLQQTRIRQLFLAGPHTLWVATAGSGLYRIRFRQGDTLVTQLTTRQGLRADSVNQISRGPAGEYWVATTQGLSVLATATGQVVPEPDWMKTWCRTTVNSIFRVSDTLFWCATNAGVLRLARDRHRIWHQQRFTTADGLCINSVQGVVQDRLGRVWAATTVGVSRSEGRQFTCIADKSPMRDVASDMIEDREGSLWLVQEEGLVQYLGDERFTLFTQRDGLLDNVVHSLLEVRPGEYWIGTQTGITIFRPEAPVGARFRPGHHRPGGPTANFIRCLFRDSRGRIWVGSRHGGAAYRDATGRWHELSNVPGLAGQHVLSINEDRRGRVWIGTHQAGVTVLDPAARHAQTFTLTNGLPSASVWKVFRDHRGTIWLGTDDCGLVRVDPDHDRFERVGGGPARLSIGSITEDSQGQLWLGSIGEGLLRFDGRRLHHYRPGGGLQFNNPFFVQCDAAGYVWVGTNKGLDYFNPRTGQVVSYGKEEGFLGQETNQNAVLLDHGGRLWVGTMGGLMRHDAARARGNTAAPVTRLTGLRIFLKDTTAFSGLALPHYLNHLTFDFVGVSLTNPGRVRYQYQLAGFDRGWMGPGPGTSVTYSNLDPGTYTFLVRAANNDGVWNVRPARFSFAIRPPWWRTWWAYVLYGATLGAALYGVRAYTLARERLRTDWELEHLTLTHLQALDKIKTEFFTNVSHELRTPLTLILGPAEQLATEPADAAVRQQGGLVLRHARKLLHLINQLLDLSKLEAGALRLTPLPGDLVAFARPLLDSFATLADAQQVKLRLLTTTQSLPLVFDPAKLEEVLSNLLSNALKFTPAGGEVTLELQEQPATPTEPAGAVELIVRDTGIGIEPQHLPHLFERFYQATHPEGVSMRAGTGIGLALVKELTELHGGTVQVASQPGAGTAFIVRLPRQPIPAPLTQNGAETLRDTVLKKATEPLPEPGEALHHVPAPEADVVLVIEDNEEVRGFILSTLCSAGYQLLEAPDGAAGVALARAQVPDLIISDVMMPGLDGYGVCQQLKTDPATSHIPVVLLTAKSAAEDKLTGLETGADSYLTKPFNPRELRAQVRNLLDLRHRLRALYASKEAPALPDAHAAAVAGRPSLDQAFLSRMREVVEQHLDDGEFSVETLSEEIGMSRTQVHRKLKALTGQAASEFIRCTRLHRAHALLQAQVATVSEVAYQVGFNSPAHFSTSFSKQFGYAPSEVARK